MTAGDFGEQPSAGYRAKLLHPDGGIETTVAILASTLSEATRQVQNLTSTYHVEVWLGGQMVRRLPYKSR